MTESFSEFLARRRADVVSRIGGIKVEIAECEKELEMIDCATKTLPGAPEGGPKRRARKKERGE
jgi:Ni,Fe-hydrogenase III large subunit